MKNSITIVAIMVSFTAGLYFGNGIPDQTQQMLFQWLVVALLWLILVGIIGLLLFVKALMMVIKDIAGPPNEDEIVDPMTPLNERILQARKEVPDQLPVN